MLQPKQDSACYFPGLERHRRVLVARLDIAQAPIEHIAGVKRNQKIVNMASIDKQASRIARASFAVAPIIPPLPRGFIRNQNQALSRLQITKSTPKWHLRLDETTLTARTSSIHLRTPSSGFRETRRVLDTYRSEFAAEQRWVTYGILKRGPSPHFARCMTVRGFPLR